MQRGADCVEAAGGRRVIAKANTPSKSPSGVRHGLCPWWTTLSEFIIFSIQYSVFSLLCQQKVCVCVHTYGALAEGMIWIIVWFSADHLLAAPLT